MYSIFCIQHALTHTNTYFTFVATPAFFVCGTRRLVCTDDIAGTPRSVRMCCTFVCYQNPITRTPLLLSMIQPLTMHECGRALCVDGMFVKRGDDDDDVALIASRGKRRRKRRFRPRQRNRVSYYIHQTNTCNVCYYPVCGSYILQ